MHAHEVEYSAAVVRWSTSSGYNYTGADDGLTSWLRERIGDRSVQVLHENQDTVDAAQHAGGVLGTLSSRSRVRVLGRDSFVARTDDCVILAYPKLTTLASASSAVTRDGMLVVFEYGAPPLLDGWITAAGAFDPLTGLNTERLDSDLHSTFTSMLMWEAEIGQGAKKGSQRHLVQHPLAKLKDAGLSEDFVVTYCATLGLSDHYWKRLREHYQQA